LKNTLRYGLLGFNEKLPMEKRMFNRRAILMNVNHGACARFIITGLAVFAFLLWGSNSSAQGLAGTAQQPAQQHASVPAAKFAKICQKEVSKFCAQKNTPKEQSECLNDHYAEASSECQKSLKEARDRFFAPCKKEVDAYCATAGYGGGKMTSCLRAQQSKLSKACADRVK
jgi:hypothetical protein